MNRKKLLFSAFVLSVFLSLAGSCHAQGTAFTYQGLLSNTNDPASGTYDFTFKLFNVVTGGSQTGSTVTQTGVTVSNGLFTVIIDFGSQFDGTPYWLELGVRSNGVPSFTTLSPRQELTPTPYSITAENLDGTLSSSQLTGTLGTALFPIPFDLIGSTGPALIEADQSGTGPGVFGNQLATTGTTPGVQGTTASTSFDAAGVYGLVSATSAGAYSAGVLGQNNSTTGDGIGVYGSQNGSGWGVYGYTPNGTGVYAYSANGYGMQSYGATGIYSYAYTADGIDAYAQSETGIGLSATHEATNGTAAGVQGSTASLDGSANGVLGIVSSTSPGGSSSGVTGQNNGTSFDGIGVTGTQNGYGYGVYGYTPYGTGVYAYSGGTGVFTEGGTGVTAYGDSYDGIDAYTFSATGVGVSGVVDTISGTGAGVQGSTYATNNNADGVYGVVESGAPGGYSAGVFGQNNSTNGDGIGVYGQQNGYGWGVYGTTPSGIGVFGETSSGTGVYGESSTGYGFYAYSSSGYGVVAESSSGTGVYAYSSSGSALTVGAGAIHVSGAGVNTSTAAFTQQTTSGNVDGDSSTIDNPLCNGDPNAILIITPNWNPGGSGGTYSSEVVGVWYDGSNWLLFNETGDTMQTGLNYNILVIKN
jgi:hypothetical protein